MKKLKFLNYCLILSIVLNMMVVATSASNATASVASLRIGYTKAMDEVVTLISNGADLHEVYEVYKNAGLLTEDEVEVLVAYDEIWFQTHQGFLTNRNINQNESYTQTYFISWNSILTAGISDAASIALFLSKMTALPALILSLVASHIADDISAYLVDQLPLEGEGVRIDILWQWHYNDNEMQERWHPYFQDWGYYY